MAGAKKEKTKNSCSQTQNVLEKIDISLNKFRFKELKI